MEDDDVFRVSEDDVAKLQDCEDCFDLADTLGVDLSGLEHLEDMKERLLMEIRKDEYGDFKQMVEMAMVGSQKENIQKRTRLLEVLKMCQTTLEDHHLEAGDGSRKRGSAAIEGFLRTEGLISDLRKDIKNRIRMVESGECIVVVSGETGAGKSTVLNLLLEEPLLPTHAMSCTSVITRISYGKKRKATILYHNKEDHVIERCDRHEFYKALRDIVFIQDQKARETITNIREVHVLMPAKLLKCGLVIVDSPGIGENDVMDSIIESFIATNEVMGFIYLIKSDNAGGVDEDKLGALLRLIIDKQERKSQGTGLPFDPSCALFICNLWDLIQKKNEDKVYNHACSKLTKYWTNLSKSQVIRFSAKKANRELSISRNFVTDDYMQLLLALQDLHSKAMERRIFSTYKWTNSVLTRCVHHLKTIVKQMNKTESSDLVRLRALSDKLNILKNNASDVIQQLKSRVDEVAMNICENFRQRLRLPQTRIRITQWIESEIPVASSWEEIKEALEDITADRISTELREWDEQEGGVKNLESTVYDEIKKGLCGIELELAKLETNLGESVSENKLPQEKATLRKKSRLQMMRSLSHMSLTDLNVYQTTNSVEEELMPVSVSVLARYIFPIKTIVKNAREKLRETKLYNTVVTSTKLKKFRKAPCKIARIKSEKFLHKCTEFKGESDILLGFIRALLQRPTKFIQQLELKIPSMIQSNQDALDHIENCRSDTKESRDMYINMMSSVEKLKDCLRKYGKGYIFVDDFKVSEIRMRDGSSKKGHRTFRSSDVTKSVRASREDGQDLKVMRGLWTRFQNGFHVKQTDVEIPIFIKIYLPSSGISETYTEVAQLRSLDNKSLARFIGISHSDAPIPAFIYDGHLTSVQDFLKRHPLDRDEYVCSILRGVVNGLVYLHSHDMVHMELTDNTVTVSMESSPLKARYAGNVKLSGACLPRKATLPRDKDSINAQEFVYLSPNVLDGAEYSTCDDVYSLGLLMMELILNIRVFHKLRSGVFQTFIDTLDPFVLLELDTSLRKLDKRTKSLIIRSLNILPQSRPTIHEFLDIFPEDSEIQHDH